MRRSAIWARVTETTWLRAGEAALFADCDVADLERVALHTKRERNGGRVTLFYDADDLRLVFGVRDSAMKLALLECSLYQLRRELATCTDVGLMRWLSEAIALRRSEPSLYQLRRELATCTDAERLLWLSEAITLRRSEPNY